MLERVTTAKHMTFISLAANGGLAGLKIIGGLIGHSSVVVADGVDSLSDMFTTLLAYVGVRISAKAADADHPYGHERFEAVYGKILAFFLALVSSGIIWQAIDEIRHPVLEQPTRLALIAAGVSIIVKLLLSRYTIHQAKKIDSSVYLADGKNYLNDALSSVFSLSGAFLAQQGWTIFQPLFSLFISFNIFRVAFELYRDSIRDLTDQAAPDELEQAVRELILAQPDVIRIDVLRSRMHAKRVFIDVEIGVAYDLSLLEAHQIAENVHDAVEAKFDVIKHIMVHVNPIIG